MKFIGIDYGAKRIGVALSDKGGLLAFPREVVPNDAHSLARLLNIIETEGVKHIVFGDTRSSGGAANSVTAEAEVFADKLASETNLPLSLAFELFSSVEASRFAPTGDTHDDSAAAAFILQRFLDMRAGR